MDDFALLQARDGFAVQPLAVCGVVSAPSRVKGPDIAPAQALARSDVIKEINSQPQGIDSHICRRGRWAGCAHVSSTSPGCATTSAQSICACSDNVSKISRGIVFWRGGWPNQLTLNSTLGIARTSSVRLGVPPARQRHALSAKQPVAHGRLTWCVAVVHHASSAGPSSALSPPVQ